MPSRKCYCKHAPEGTTIIVTSKRYGRSIGQVVEVERDSIGVVDGIKRQFFLNGKEHPMSHMPGWESTVDPDDVKRIIEAAFGSDDA